MDPNPNSIPFTYELAGSLSGAPTALLLEGTAVAPDEIRFETRAVAPGEPLVGDRTLMALPVVDPLILVALDPELFRADAAPETFRVEARLEGEGQRLVGRLVVVGLWAVGDGRVALRGQITDGWLGLEPGERVASWAEDTGMCVLPDPSGRVTERRRKVARAGPGTVAVDAPLGTRAAFSGVTAPAPVVPHCGLHPIL